MNNNKTPFLSIKSLIIILAALIFSISLLVIGMKASINKVNSMAINADQTLTSKKPMMHMISIFQTICANQQSQK